MGFKFDTLQQQPQLKIEAVILKIYYLLSPPNIGGFGIILISLDSI